MSNCGNKIKMACPPGMYATCVETEVTPNTQSELFEETCLDVEGVLQDMYDQIGEIKEETDLTALGELCLSYTLESGKIVVKNVLAKFEEEICTLREKVDNLENRQLCDIPIGECIDDFECLATPCDGTIVTLGDWIKAVTTKICE